MKTIEIFDPAMCCSTGVCGPAIDPELARFAGDVEWLKQHGAQITRHNLAQEPMAFASNAAVTKTLNDGGPECLPLVLVGGEVRAMGAYPARDKLLHWAGIVPLAAAPEAPTSAAGACRCGPKGRC